LGQGSITPARATLVRSNLVESNGAGITDTIERAELAAKAAAITHDHIHIATDHRQPYFTPSSNETVV